MKEVVCEVIADVAKDTARIHCGCGIPVVEEDGMRQLPEWRGKDNEEGGWHDQPVLVHGEIVMNTV